MTRSIALYAALALAGCAAGTHQGTYVDGELVAISLDGDTITTALSERVECDRIPHYEICHSATVLVMIQGGGQTDVVITGGDTVDSDPGREWRVRCQGESCSVVTLLDSDGWPVPLAASQPPSHIYVTRIAD